MVKSDKCWIVENGFRVTSAEIMSFTENLVLIKTQSGKALRLPKHRLFYTEEKSEESVQDHKTVQKKM